MSQYFGGVAICQWCDECLDILVQKSHPNHTQPLPPSLQHCTYGRNHWQLATPFVWPFTADLPYEGCCSESRGPDSLVHIKLFFFTFYSENMPVPGQRNYQPSISVYVKLSYKYLYRQDNSEVPAHQRSLVIASVSIYFSTLNLTFCRKQIYDVNCMSFSRVIHRIPAPPTNHHVFPRSLQFPSAVWKILSPFKPHPLFPYSKSCLWFPVLWNNDSS